MQITCCILSETTNYPLLSAAEKKTTKSYHENTTFYIFIIYFCNTNKQWNKEIIKYKQIKNPSSIRAHHKSFLLCDAKF